MAELAGMFVGMGMTSGTAATAAREVHRDHRRAVRLHVTQELGLDPEEQASPWAAAISSFVMFSIGALVPLLPYLLGLPSLVAGLAGRRLGLLVAGAVASVFTAVAWWWGAAPAAGVRRAGRVRDVRRRRPAGDRARAVSNAAVGRGSRFTTMRR